MYSLFSLLIDLQPSFLRLLFFSLLSNLNQGHSRETRCLVTATHIHTYFLSLYMLKQCIFYVYVCVCVTVGSLAGGIQSCQKWSRCCSISFHQSSPTLLPISSTSASETTRSNQRYISWCETRGHSHKWELSNSPEGALTHFVACVCTWTV